MLRLELESRGFQMKTRQDGAAALELVDKVRPEVVLLDIMMPGSTGLELMRELREYRNTPVILVTAQDTDKDKIEGLDLGADDYVVKPFNVDELAARVHAVLRRHAGARGVKSIIRGRDVEIDLAQRSVYRAGEPVYLTHIEWLMLQHLAADPGVPVSTVDLLTRVWGPEFRDDVEYIRVWIYRLRRKLEQDPRHPELIVAMPGGGYVLRAAYAINPEPPP